MFSLLRKKSADALKQYQFVILIRTHMKTPLDAGRGDKITQVIGRELYRGAIRECHSDVARRTLVITKILITRNVN